MLALLVAFLLGGGGSPFLDLVRRFDKATKKVVVESERRDAVQFVLKEMSTAIKANDKSRDRSVKALHALVTDYNATATDHLAVLDAQGATNTAFQETMITLHRELKDKVTAEEWAAIVERSGLKPAER